MNDVCYPTMDAAVAREPVKMYEDAAVTIPAVIRHPAALTKDLVGVSFASEAVMRRERLANNK